MQRRSVGNIEISPNIRCQRVYPVPDSKKQVSELETIGLILTGPQAIHLATVLLVAAQDWSKIEVTAYRLKQRKDGTHQITVTSASPR